MIRYHDGRIKLTFFTSVEAVDPRTVRPCVKGEMTDRAWHGKGEGMSRSLAPARPLARLRSPTALQPAPQTNIHLYTILADYRLPIPCADTCRDTCLTPSPV